MTPRPARRSRRLVPASGPDGWLSPPTTVSRLHGAAAGTVSAATTLAAGQLGAALVPDAISPVIGAARAVVAATPTSLREALVSRAGTADKPALLAGVTVVVLLLGAVVGVRARTSRATGRAGVLLLATVAFVVTATRPGVHAAASGLVLLAAATLGGAVLELLLPADNNHRPSTAEPDLHDLSVDRRRFFVRSGAVLAGAAWALAGARSLGAARSVEAIRAAVRLPDPGRRAAGVIPAAPVVPGVTPLVTSNALFYKIDTAIGGDPQVDPAAWSLSIGGLLDRPLTLSYADLLAMPQTETWATIGCVGNDVGGPLVGTARWQGVLLADVLRAAGPRAAASQVAMTSVDGYTGAFPLTIALDGRQALIALGMNGEALPVAHGFPARVVVPGLYGYESAVKWLARVDLVDDSYRAFWVQRGYAKAAPFRTQSRIDIPADGRTATRDGAGNVVVAGMAWAPHRGIAQVEVSIDGGRWQPATLAPDLLGPDTWRPWTWQWHATPGPHQLRVRATDATGETQPGRPRGVLPDGATGWHTITVTVA